MPNNAFDEFADRARVRVAGQVLPTDGDISPADREYVLRDVAKYAEETHLGPNEVADASGVPLALYERLQARDPSVTKAEANDAIRRLNSWYDAEHRADVQPQNNKLVPTRIVNRFVGAVKVAREYPDGVIVSGPSGVGKTFIMEALAQEISGCYLVTVTPESRTAHGFKRMVARTITGRNSDSYFKLDAIIDRLKSSGRSCKVLMIDQAHELKPDALRMVQAIGDGAKCSFLLCGTQRVDDLTRYDDDPLYGQFASRVGVRVSLCEELYFPKPGKAARNVFTTDDIRRLLRTELKLHVDALRLLVRLANEPGHLRRVTRIFRWAERLAANKAAIAITLDHVMAACHVVEGATPAPQPAASRPRPAEALA